MPCAVTVIDCDPVRPVCEKSLGPVMEQLLTPEAFQLMVEDVFGGTRAGLAEMVTKGLSTVTVMFALTEPPGPVQVIAYDVVTESAPVETPVELLVAPPVEKPPAAVQEVAPVEFQERIED